MQTESSTKTNEVAPTRSDGVSDCAVCRKALSSPPPPVAPNLRESWQLAESWLEKARELEGMLETGSDPDFEAEWATTARVSREHAEELGAALKGVSRG